MKAPLNPAGASEAAKGGPAKRKAGRTSAAPEKPRQTTPRRAATIGYDDASETRRRILVAAEKVFAEHGFDIATLRDITDTAGVNLAAVNYYFASKDALIQEVLDRRMMPYSRARLLALETCQKAVGDRAPTVPEIAEALVRPMVKLSRDLKGSGRSLIRLLLQVRARPTEDTLRIFIDRVDPTVHRFVEAFGAAAPHLSHEELYWRYNFSVGAVMQVLTDADPVTNRLNRLSSGRCDTNDDEALIRQLVAYISAGFQGKGEHGRQSRNQH